jgi:RAP domain
LFDAIARTKKERISDFNPQALSITAWAFATLNHAAPLLFDAIARTAKDRIADFNPQALSNVAWSFAVLNHVNTKSLTLTDADSPFVQPLLSILPSSFSAQNLAQLHQYHLWCREQSTSLRWMSDELKSRCMEAFVSRAGRPSRLQIGIVLALETLQEVSQVQEEVLTDIGYRLDAVIVYQGIRLGVEVDGPSHFVGPSSQSSPNGKTVLKHRQLQTLEGWNLVSIPYWEWNEICNDTSGPKHAYLQKLLDGAVADL